MGPCHTDVDVSHSFLHGQPLQCCRIYLYVFHRTPEMCSINEVPSAKSLSDIIKTGVDIRFFSGQ